MEWDFNRNVGRVGRKGEVVGKKVKSEEAEMVPVVYLQKHLAGGCCRDCKN